MSVRKVGQKIVDEESWCAGWVAGWNAQADMKKIAEDNESGEIEQCESRNREDDNSEGGFLMRRMHWWVFVDDFNAREIKLYDIFEHGSFARDVEKAYKKYHDDFERFEEEVKKTLRYYFWSKTEWEIIIGPWCGMAEPIKMDVYGQVTANWDVFIQYVWEQAHARKSKHELNAQPKMFIVHE